MSADRSALLSAVACIALAAAHAEARPSSDRRAKALFDAGQKAYNRGQFADALKKYLEAYDLKPLPGFLFNVGQCHRQLGQYERAAFFYRRYLALSPRPPKNAALVKKLIAEVERKLVRSGDGEDASSADQYASAQPGETSRARRSARPSEASSVAGSVRPSEAPRVADAPLGLEDTSTAMARPKLEPERVAVAGAPNEDAVRSLAEPPPVVTESGGSIFKKWWLWAGLGVVAAGATAYVIASPHPKATTLSQIDGR